MSDLDYGPRPKRGQGEESGRVPPAPRKSPPSQPAPEREEYVPKAARKARQEEARPSYAPRPRQRASGRSSAKRTRFLGSKAFWRLTAVAGLVVLLGSGLLAEIYQGRPRDAVADFAALVDLGDQSYEQASAAWGQQDTAQALKGFDAAAGYYERALAVRPDANDIRANLAEVYMYQGQIRQDSRYVEQAFEALEETLRYEPDKPQALLLYGIGYLTLGETGAAVTMWQRVLEVAPGTPQADEAQRLIEQYGQP